MKMLFIIALSISIFACKKSSCGYYNGHQLYKGSNGGCYYINSNGNKTYVDNVHCDC